MSQFYTLTHRDVGHTSVSAFGRTWWLTDVMGRVLPGDVGKRVYRVKVPGSNSHILQVENNEQRDKRLEKSK